MWRVKRTAKNKYLHGRKKARVWCYLNAGTGRCGFGPRDGSGLVGFERMDALMLGRFQTLVAARLGFHLREQERELLVKVLEARLQSSRLNGDAYLALLQNGGAQAESEWKELSIRLTNQESYFFRDEGQFALLRDHVLPEIIERNRKSRTLRIWSAGCSTGQEPYSLAILVDQLLPSRGHWKVFILGTDLSEAALSKARAGVYSAWSFRAMARDIQENYFAPRHKQKEFELEKRVRDMVSFQHGNLLHDPFPSPASRIHEIDLLLCRNVFIYFKREAVATVLRKFEQTLSPDGYLLTGHTELHNMPLGDLRPRAFPQTVIYQRCDTTATDAARPASSSALPMSTHAPGASIQKAAAPRGTRFPVPSALTASFASAPMTPVPTTTTSAAATSVGATSVEATDSKVDAKTDFLAQAATALKQGSLDAALALLEGLPQRETNFEAQCLAAQACANAGRLDDAESYCQKAARLDPVAPLPPHVLARIAQERGDHEEAKRLLKKVIYLAPALPLPYVELGDIYQSEGDGARARTMRKSALELLADLPAGQPVPSHALSLDAATTVGEVQRHLREQAA